LTGEVATTEFWNNTFPSPMPPHYSKANQTGNYQKIQDALKNGFRALPAEQARYHRQGEGNEYNIKLLHPDGREAVYNKNGELATDPLNLGTKNVQNPGEFSDDFAHAYFDVIPYYLMGNTIDDEPGLSGMIKRINTDPAIPSDYNEYWKDVYNYGQNTEGTSE
jgi:hypothetical protein